MTDSFNDYPRAPGPQTAGTPWDNAASARKTIVNAARRCIVTAISSRVPADATPGELYASDETFRQLNNCVTDYARAIGSLGDGTDRGLGLILSAVTEAAAPYEPHPALLRAVEEWYREVINATPNTKTD